MKVAVADSNGHVGLVERADPVPTDDFVLVKIHLVPTCTEYKRLGKGPETEHLGHEAVGEVVQIARSGNVEVGDRVVVMWMVGCGKCSMCISGDVSHCTNRTIPVGFSAPRYAQFVLQKDWLCKSIPDDVSYQHASAGLCGLAPSFAAMELMHLAAVDTVLITGLGPVGLGGVINASHRGARIIAVESIPYRAKLGSSLGADIVLDPQDGNVLQKIMDLTDGIGVDKAVECSGATAAQRLCIDAARSKGEIGLPALSGDLAVNVKDDLIIKGLVLRGNWNMNFADYPKLMKVVQASGDKLDRFITHTFPMSQAQKAWELQATGACGKVILDPWA